MFKKLQEQAPGGQIYRSTNKMPLEGRPWGLLVFLVLVSFFFPLCKKMLSVSELPMKLWRQHPCHLLNWCLPPIKLATFLPRVLCDEHWLLTGEQLYVNPLTLLLCTWHNYLICLKESKTKTPHHVFMNHTLGYF